jgi:hypothetical protein
MLTSELVCHTLGRIPLFQVQVQNTYRRHVGL